MTPLSGDGVLTRKARQRLAGLHGGAVWFTGLPAAGKTTLARSVEHALLATGIPAYVLDADDVRDGLAGELRLTGAGGAEDLRRVAHLAAILADAGVLALVSLVGASAADRADAREIHRKAGQPCLEVWVDTPRAASGHADYQYEPPAAPDVRITPRSLRAATSAVLTVMRSRGMLGPTWGAGTRHIDRSLPDGAALTVREREVLELIGLGLTNKQIAADLSIQLPTVKNHVHHILEKLHAYSRGRAVAITRIGGGRLGPSYIGHAHDGSQPPAELHSGGS